MDSTEAKHELMDDEQLERLSQTLELLFGAGYFRAKIKGLGNFDKIVGGMVWCISHCAQTVDVDLLYSDNQTIGQKIALTERIVQVLPALSCPFSLEPHQIQGLDLEHIYPVVKWLVKEANFVRERLGNETLNFAVYQFGQQGWHFSDEMEHIGHSWVRPLVKRRPRKVYKRVKRMDAGAHYSDQNLGIDSTNADDAEGKKMVAGPSNADPMSDQQKLEAVEEEERLIVMEAEGATETANGRLLHRTAAGQDMMMVAYLEKSSASNATADGAYEDDDVEALERELEELEIEEANLDKEQESEAEQSQLLKAKLAELLEGDAVREQQQQKAHEAYGDEMVEQMRTLLAQRDAIKADESSFKVRCRQQLAELDAQIERLEHSSETDADGDLNGAEEDNSEATLHDRLTQARELAREVGATNRDIVRLSRRLGARPSQVELAQYQRKFVELCNQISTKHGETKRQYTLYNTLVTKRDFVQREINLLNSIDDQRELAQREEYRDSLLDNLQQIGRGIDDSLDKMLCKRRLLQEQRDHLHSQLQILLDKQRLYMKTVGEFQQACQRNEQLRDALENSDQIQSQQ